MSDITIKIVFLSVLLGITIVAWRAVRRRNREFNAPDSIRRPSKDGAGLDSKKNRDNTGRQDIHNIRRG